MLSLFHAAGIYLREIRTELAAMLGVYVEECTICKFLASVGFTRQKLVLRALQQDELLRQQYASDVSLLSREMFIFIDETGAEIKNLIRRYGYSLRGKPIQSQKWVLRGERVSAIACLSVAGLLDVKTVKGTTDGDEFYDFVQTHLLPHLLPFDGTNPHSIVVLDNCTVHHVPEVIKSIQDTGALLLYLPPYSPDYNPIEEAFSKVKTTLKSYENDYDASNISDVETLLLMSFAEITQEDCIGWIDHAKIYN